MAEPETSLPPSTSRVAVVGAMTPEKQRIADEVRRRVSAYLDLEVSVVEAACNAERERGIEWLRKMPTEETLKRWGQTITASGALVELAPPFKLRGLTAVEIDFSLDRYPPAPDCPMGVPRGGGPTTICVFADAIDAGTLCARLLNSTVAEVTFHELLHACGEVQHDGVVRYNWAGAEAIKRLLGVNHEMIVAPWRP